MNITCSAKACPVLLSAACVFYEGVNLPYTGINMNDNLQVALEKIDTKFNSLIDVNIYVSNGTITSNRTVTLNGKTLSFVGSSYTTIFQPAGTLQLGSLAGVGNRMVIADTNGVLGTQAIPLGTVTSVDMSVPTGFAISGNPVTTVGTLALAFASGYSLPTNSSQSNWDTAYNWVNSFPALVAGQYLTNNGTSLSWSAIDLSGYVPYTGATQDVDLGTHKLTADAIAFSLSPTNSPGAGQIAYYGGTGALAYLMDNTTVMCQIGQQLYAYVTNDDSVTIQKGQPVYLYSATGNRASVKLAANTGDATSAKTLGLAAQDITSGQRGFIMCQGVLDGLNTGMYNSGDTLYLGATAGSLTSTKPYAPNHLVYIGVVERANNGNGQIYVRPQNGYELDEIHDVDLISTPPVNNDILTYITGTNNLWKPRSIATILGYTPFNLPSLTSGSVLFSNGTTIAQNNANLFWDNVNGRLGIGTNSPSYTFHISGANAGIFLTRTSPDESFIVLSNTGLTSGAQIRGLATALGMRFTNNLGNVEWARFHSTGNFSINSNSDAGYKFDVSGTARIQDNLLISKNQNTTTSLVISNTNSHADSNIITQYISDVGSGTSSVGKNSTLKTAYKSISAKDAYFYNGTTGGDITIHNDFASGNIKFAAGGSSAAQVTISSSGSLSIANLTSGSVPFIGASGLVTQDNSNFFWDNTNKRLGIGTNAPTESLVLYGATLNNPYIRLKTNAAAVGTTYANGIIFDRTLGGATNNIGIFTDPGNGHVTNADAITFALINTPWTRLFTIQQNAGLALGAYSGNYKAPANSFIISGSVFVGTPTDAGYKLDVNGTTRFQGSSLITGSTTASGAIARGVNMTPTLVAAANNDVLVGLDINPTFTNGAFTGVSNWALRIQGGNISLGTSTSNPTINLAASNNASATQFVINNSAYGGTLVTFRNPADSRYFRISGINFDLYTSGNIYPTNVIAGQISFGSSYGTIIYGFNNSYLNLGGDTVVLASRDNTAASISLLAGNGDINFQQRPSGVTTLRAKFAISTGNFMIQNGGTFTDSGERLQVIGDVKVTGTIYQNSASDALYNFQNGGANKWRIGNAYVAGANYFQLYDSVNSLERIRWNNNSTATFTSDFTFVGGSNAVATFQAAQPDVNIQATGGSNAVSLSFTPSNGYEGIIQNNVTNGFIQVKTASTIRVTFKNGGQVNFQPLAADPAGAGAGDVYYNSGTNKLRLYDGTSWVDLN